jgi:hypothetical protein
MRNTSGALSSAFLYQDFNWFALSYHPHLLAFCALSNALMCLFEVSSLRDELKSYLFSFGDMK